MSLKKHLSEYVRKEPTYVNCSIAQIIGNNKRGILNLCNEDPYITTINNNNLYKIFPEISISRYLSNNNNLGSTKINSNKDITVFNSVCLSGERSCITYKRLAKTLQRACKVCKRDRIELHISLIEPGVYGFVEEIYESAVIKYVCDKGVKVYFYRG